jgi:hypothetical protein
LLISWVKRWDRKSTNFKRVCNAYEFTKGQRAILDEVYAELDTLLPKRNFIVHGTTYQIGKNSDSVQPYRIGMTRGDFDHMNQFIAQDFDGPHAFTVERIALVTTKCVALRENLQSCCSRSSDHFKPGNDPSSVENFPRRVVIAGAAAALRCRHEQARANPVAPRSARA